MHFVSLFSQSTLISSFPQPHTSIFWPVLKNCSPRFLGVTNTEASRGAEGSKWTNSLLDYLQESLHISFSKGKHFFVTSIWAMSPGSEANFGFNFCVSNFSALLSPSVHIIGLTHSGNSAKCLIY